MRISRQMMFKIALALFILFSTVAGVYLSLEITERLQRRGPPTGAETLVGEPNMFLIDRTDLTQAYASSLWEEIGKRYRPNSRLEATVIEGQHLVVQINERGWRSDSVDVPKPEGVYRIVCLGGSTTVEGWSNQTTYPAFLQKKLRSVVGSDQIEVVNCGISGAGASTELERLDDALQLQPDMILEYNGVNDILSNLKLKERERTVRPFEELVFSNLRAMLDRCRAERVEFVLCTFCRPSIEQLAPTQIDYFEKNVQYRWDGVKYGFDFQRYCTLVDRYNAELYRFCAANDCPSLPVAEQLGGGIETFVDICHMTSQGIEAKATIIAEELLKQFEAIGETARQTAPASDGSSSPMGADGP